MVTIVVALSLVTLSASLASAESSTAKTAKSDKNFLPKKLKGPAPDSVNIGISTINLIWLPVLVAMGNGYFDQIAKRFHTHFNYHVYGSAAISEPAFIGGTDQFTAVTTPAYLPAYAQGQDQKSIFTFGTALGVVLQAAAKYKASHGRNVGKFDNVTWCQTGAVGVSHTAIELEQAIHNLNNITIATLANASAASSSIEAGRCDIAAAPPETASQLVIDKSGYVVENLISTPATVDLMGEFVGYIFTTSHAFEKKYPALTQAITDAAVKGLKFVQSHRTDTKAVYNALPDSAQQAESPEIFARAYPLVAAIFDPKYNTAQVSAQMVNDTVYDIKGTGVVPSDAAVKPNEAFTNKYVIQAYKDLGLAPATGPASGPLKLPRKVGKPTTQAAKAYAVLSGKPAPPANGESKLLGSTGK